MCKFCSSKQRKRYYKENKKAVVKQTSNYKVEKMKRIPVFKFEVRQRTRIYQAFKAQGLRKNNRTWKYLNCSSRFFQKWIEFQFYDGMTLKNYGKYWHIDHVKPCSLFDLRIIEQVKECFNWKNLRPYRADKNIKKNKTYKPKDILLQELLATIFINKYGSEKSPAQSN